MSRTCCFHFQCFSWERDFRKDLLRGRRRRREAYGFPELCRRELATAEQGKGFLRGTSFLGGSSPLGHLQIFICKCLRTYCYSTRTEAIKSLQFCEVQWNLDITMLVVSKKNIVKARLIVVSR